MLQKRFIAIAGLSFIRLNAKIGASFLWKSAARTDKKRPSHTEGPIFYLLSLFAIETSHNCLML